MTYGEHSMGMLTIEPIEGLEAVFEVKRFSASYPIMLEQPEFPEVSSARSI